MGLLLRLVHLVALGIRTNRNLLSRSHHPGYELLWSFLFSQFLIHTTPSFCSATQLPTTPFPPIFFKLCPLEPLFGGISKYLYNPSRKFPLPTPSLIEIILCSNNSTSVRLSSEIFVPYTNTSASAGGGGPFFYPHCTL